MNNYEAWNLSHWDYPKSKRFGDKIKYFLRFGILAANIHNTQPWKFKIINNSLVIEPDLSKLLQYADPTGKNLWISLGCCVKNVEVIAAFHGYKTSISFDEQENVILSFAAGGDKILSQLAPFITKRFSNRMPYSDKPIEEEKLKKLAGLKAEGVSYYFNYDKLVIEKTAELYGKAVVMLTKISPGIAKELVKWLKVSSSDTTEGMPMFIQGFSGGQSKIMKKVMAVAPPSFGAKMVAMQDMKKINGSPLVAVIANSGKDKKDWVDVGRAYQELALTCFKEGVFITPMHSIVEYKDTAKELNKLFGINRLIPQMFFRLGYASNTHYHTPRRPLEWSMDTESELARSIDVNIEFNKIKIGKFDINYIKSGHGEPILLIHGGNIGWGQWYPNIPILAKKFTVYALDLPGGGRSTKIDFEKTNFNEFVDVTNEFIGKLKLEKPHLVGSSVGGWIAVKVALENQNVRKLVLADAVGFSDFKDGPSKLIGMYPFAKFMSNTIFKKGRSNIGIEKLLRSVFANPNLMLSRQFIDYFYETTDTSHNLLFISKMISSLTKLLLVKDLPKLQNETLIIWGEKDKSLPLEKSELNFSLIPRCQVKIIKNAGHIVCIEKATEFNKAVLDFLID